MTQAEQEYLEFTTNNVKLCRTALIPIMNAVITTHQLFIAAKLSRQRQFSEGESEEQLEALDAEIIKLHDSFQQLTKSMAEIGRHLFLALGLWQEAGATLRDLCELVGAPYWKVVKKCTQEELDKGFGAIIYFHQLDYEKAGKRPIQWTDYAPFTHCMREALNAEGNRLEAEE